LKTLVRAAIAYNQARRRTKVPARAKPPAISKVKSKT
jgi:hypothetical protein